MRRVWHKESCTDAPCTCGAANAHLADMEERVDMAEGSERHLTAMLRDAIEERDALRAQLAAVLIPTPPPATGTGEREAGQETGDSGAKPASSLASPAGQNFVREAALEEAARAVDDLRRSQPPKNNATAVRRLAWERAAAVIRSLIPTPPPATRVPRQYCTEGCPDYPRCSHASLPPGVLPESMRAAPATPLDALGESGDAATVTIPQDFAEKCFAEERAAVLALARKEAKEWAEICQRGTGTADEMPARRHSMALYAFAARIERGDHLSTPTEKPPGERT